MSALFFNLTMFHHKNIITFDDSAQPMSNNNNSHASITYKLVNILLDSMLTLSIKSTRSFIKNQYFWFLYQCSRYGNSLFLATTQFHTLRSNKSLQSFRESLLIKDKLTYSRHITYLLEFFLCVLSIFTPISNVVFDVIVKQGWLLTNQTNTSPNFIQWNIFDILIVKYYRSRVDIVISLNQFYNCRFTTSTSSYEGNKLTLLYWKGNILQNISLIFIYRLGFG